MLFAIRRFFPVAVFVLITVFTSSLLFPNVSTTKAEANSAKTVVLDQSRFLTNSIVGHSNMMNFSFENVYGKTVKLQRSENGKWINIAEHSFSSDEKGKRFISWRIKAPVQEGYYQYRLIDDYQLNLQFSLYNTDPSHYDKYTNIAYEAVKDYCGNTLILTNDERINQSSSPSKNVLGLAFGYENTFSIRPGMEKDQVEWVARHECGHILQHRAYDNDRKNHSTDNSDWLNEEMADYHKNQNNSPVEKDADCIALYLSDDWDEFYSDCYGQRGQAAFNIIHGKTALSPNIDDVFQDSVMLKNTGFALEDSRCVKNVKCSQKFENGTAYWTVRNDEYKFVSNNGSVDDKKYFAKSIRDAFGD